MSEQQTTNPEYDLVITRTFNAPRELVFKVWTDADHLKHWWGPTGFTIHVAQADIRPGGIFHYCMKAADGHEMWGKFVYHEIVSPERIVFVNSFSDEEGNIVRAPFSQTQTFPLEIYNVFTFTEEEGTTTITLRGGPINATEEEIQFFHSMHESMQQGFAGTFGQLDDYLATL
ncbi:SRPBCC domain-containing protein [Paenibacillus sp. WQ 127069]|uniref:SRPBCC domain-containing protein n=1 Tax=Paenibacillus baimaensis TaxID=2982185 RepID=A0ABT2UEQ4_9BACL|nr:SRPBCC domain-containing protein [Paenibacillus sp. WQ 127069]MCU6793124.1 SRPBCC domain-containing protein [Paenibacillus sp. WQ 127069]